MSANDSCRRVFRQTGLSYVEVLVATVLVAISIAPALTALNSGLTASGVHESHVADHYHLMSKVEDVLAQSFADLSAAASAAGNRSTPTSYSDSAGADRRRLVFLSRYDGDNADGDDDPFTGMDDGLLWLRVEVEDTAHVFETLTTR
ncbi:MAG: hypothetical protein GWN84_17105 [Gammaproteobacteria bacterium]|nr:hypothetical protein [Gammaproteobacteria bacterium]NIR84556.1 hypothetical protein [Gammaproteobacteria bacterium]NIR90459.1 hypothetical protein [Gammaproteobacteria bacterium]NIU05607.1 hypothetical protein [Gammaproteobacteria bacterium]NIV52746.1 hypothetical protein [Gammaproteobacteria bacterium]